MTTLIAGRLQKQCMSILTRVGFIIPLMIHGGQLGMIIRRSSLLIIGQSITGESK